MAKTMTIGSTSSPVDVNVVNGKIVGTNIKSKGSATQPVYFDDDGIATPIDITPKTIAPIAEKTYEGFIASSNTNGSGADFIFADVKPKNGTALWSIKYTIDADYTRSNNSVKYMSSHIVEIYGYGNTPVSSNVWNAIANTSYRPIYYVILYRSSTATNTMYLGTSIYNCNNNTSTTNKRNMTIRLLSYENCEVTLHDSIANTDYTTYYTNKSMSARSTYDLAAQGLQETGDNNTYDRTYLNTAYFTNGSFRLAPYSIFGFDRDNKAQGISLYSNNYSSSTTTYSADRVFNTNGYDYRKGLYYISSGTNYAANGNCDTSPYFVGSLIDIRYSDNCIYSYTNTNFTMVPRKPVYIRGIIKEDDLFYLQPFDSTHVIVEGYKQSDTMFVIASGSTTNISERLPLSANFVYKDLISGSYYLWNGSKYTITTDYASKPKYKKVWTQDIPSSVEKNADGYQYVYWFIGYPYVNSTYLNGQYQLSLFPENKVYWYKGGQVVEYEPEKVAKEATKLSNGRTLKVNLASTNASTAFDGSANITDIGVAGALPIANGGTGQTTGVNAANALINSLSGGSAVPEDTDLYISQYVGGGSTTITYHRRPHSALWSYVKGKADTTYVQIGNCVDLTSNQTIGGTKTFSNINNVKYSTSTTSNITPAVDGLANPPWNADLFHDHFAFLRYHKIQSQETTTDGTTWTEATKTIEPLFAQTDGDVGRTTILTTNETAYRFTLKNTSFAYSGANWYELAVGYTSPFSSFEIKIEYGPDNETWEEIHKSTITGTAAPYFLRNTTSYTTDGYLRFTFTKKSNITTGSVCLHCIRAWCTRKGSQGLGAEQQFPYRWNSNEDIYPYSNNTKTLGTPNMKWKAVYATSFVGDITGNATTATKATQDGSGNNIVNTYATKSETLIDEDWLEDTLDEIYS